MAQRRAQTLLVLLVMAVLLAVVVIITHNFFTKPYPGLNDFMSRWEGARAYWVDGLNPYGDEASLQIQARIYGRRAAPDEDPGYFAYPMYTVFLVWPLVYLPYSWASAVWMALLEVCLVASLFLLLDLFRWKPKPWLLGLLLLWSLAFYFSARGLILGQPGVLVAFLEILTIWALTKTRTSPPLALRGRSSPFGSPLSIAMERGQTPHKKDLNQSLRILDTLAGVALALSTIKPQMGFLIVPLLLLWGLRTRRWRFVITFAAVFGGLMLVSFLMQPSWLGDWLGQLALYPQYTALGSPVWIIVQYYLGLRNAAEYIVMAVLVGLMLWNWYGVLIAQHPERFLWAAALTLTITHLIAPRTATPHYVIFFLPLVFWFSRLSRVRYGNWWNLLLILALLVLPWIHFVQTVTGEFEHPTLYLPLPFGVLALLWLTRRAWWQFALGGVKT
ncbi:MAG TPA: glycosyltransferase family 87 protein [Phototrophicaceae bacterium]|nr:glycosyltransferase family 87 protein [Phototrophicaceae bacterium]